MATFGEKLRDLMAERGVSLRGLAARVPTDTGHLSRVSRDLRPPSAALAERLDDLLAAGGELAALRPSVPVEWEPAATEADAGLFDLAAQATASDLPDGALDLLDGVIDRLCRDYPTVAPGTLSDSAKTYLTRVFRLLDGRVSLTEHRELLVRAGWLSVLLSCTLFDAGDKAGAEMVRPHRAASRRAGRTRRGPGVVLGNCCLVRPGRAGLPRRRGLQ